MKVKKLEEDSEHIQNTVAIKNQQISRLEAKASKLEDDLKKSKGFIYEQAQENANMVAKLETEYKLAKEDLDRCMSK